MILGKYSFSSSESPLTVNTVLYADKLIQNQYIGAFMM